MSRLIIAVSVVIIILAGIVESQAANPEKVINVGFMLDVTGIGAGWGGREMTKEIACDEINAAGGVKLADGSRASLKLIKYDNRSDPKESVINLRRLSEGDRCPVVLMGTLSGVCLVATQVLQRKVDDPSDTGIQVPSLISLSTLPGIPAISEWCFRNGFLQTLGIKILLERLGKTYKVKTCGTLVTADDGWSKKIYDEYYIPFIKELGWTLVKYEEVKAKDTDLSVPISKLKAAKPDIFVTSTLAENTGRALLEVKRQRWEPKAIMGNQGSWTPEFLDIAGKAGEGFFCPIAYDEQDPRYQPLRQKIEARGGKFTGAMVDSYEALYLLKEVIEKAGIEGTDASLQKDRRKIRDTMAGWKNWRSPVSGMVWGFTAERESGKTGVIIQVKGGKGIVWNP